nr:MAG TPA: hypothetical protein [Caudoviricetes sp.]
MKASGRNSKEHLHFSHDIKTLKSINVPPYLYSAIRPV